METTSVEASVTVGFVGITVMVDPVAPELGAAAVLAVPDDVTASVAAPAALASGVILVDPSADDEPVPDSIGSPRPADGV
jgi:hypothetical protein